MDRRAPDRRPPGETLGLADLRADCSRCFGLCCVVPAFAASADFGVDMPAGRPCANLQQDFRCRIHDRLRPAGFVGCTVYDCFGAGQRVSGRFPGRGWRADDTAAQRMFEAFPVARNLHELLWLLTEAAALPVSGPLAAQLAAAAAEADQLAAGEVETLAALDLAPLRRVIAGLLQRASQEARAQAAARIGIRLADRRPRGRFGRAGTGLAGADLAGADLAGGRLAGADLRGATLRGACLIAADLRRADLGHADLLGADLRGAELAGADLERSIFLSQFQVNAALGDRDTRLPPALLRPEHWGPAERPAAG